VLVLALVACKDRPAPTPTPSQPPIVAADAAPQPAWSDEFARSLLDVRANVSKAWLAAKELRRETLEGERAFPTDPLPALDFTRASNNAIFTGDTRLAREILVPHARFRIVHLDDDPWQIAMLADGMMSEEHEKTKYRAYRRELEMLVRAKYVVIVLGEGKPAVSFDKKITTPAQFDGIALVYEIATTKLLAGIPLHASSKTTRASSTDYYRGPDGAMLELETIVRDQLYDGFEKRAASVKRETYVYMQVDDL
jgi:hypothetical protein